MFIIFAVEDEAQSIDQILHKTAFEGFQYLSFKLNDSSARISAMHANELINVRVRFETLYGAKVNDAVIKDGKEIRLDSLLKDQKVNNIPLFNTVEQGSGKASLDVHIVLNPRVISQARK